MLLRRVAALLVAHALLLPGWLLAQQPDAGAILHHDSVYQFVRRLEPDPSQAATVRNLVLEREGIRLELEEGTLWFARPLGERTVAAVGSGPCCACRCRRGVGEPRSSRRGRGRSRAARARRGRGECCPAADAPPSPSRDQAGITAAMMYAHLRRMGRYSAWANRRPHAACGQRSEDEYHKPRPAFFGAVHGTLNHLLIGDRVWRAPIEGRPSPNLRLDDRPWGSLVELKEAARP